MLILVTRNLTKKSDADLTLTGDALRLWNRTLALADLPKGWDGGEAQPMGKKTIQNMQRLIKAGISTDFAGWVLFPDDNGTILMQSTDGKSSISIGNNSYSFVSTKNDQVVTGEDIRFSATSVLKTLRTL